MRTKLLLPLAMITLWAAAAMAQTPSWVNAWSMSVSGLERPSSIGTDAANNFYLLGYAFDNEVPDQLAAVTLPLMSWTPSGETRWVRTVISRAVSREGRMCVDADGNVYVVTAFTGPNATIDRGGSDTVVAGGPGMTLLVLAYTAEGNLRWIRSADATDSIGPSGIALTPQGVWIAGTFTSTATLGGTELTSAGAADLFLTLVGTDGTFHNAVRGGGPSGDQCDGLGADAAGNVVLLGRVHVSATFGTETVTTLGQDNYVLVRYRPDATVAWARVDGGPDYGGFAATMTVDRTGNTTVGVSFFGSVTIGGRTVAAVSEADGVIARYNAQGVLQWSVRIGGEFMQFIRGLSTDPQGNLFIAGFSQILADGELFVLKVAPAGTLLWQVTNSRADELGGVDDGVPCVDAAGNIYVSGQFSGKTRFGTRTLVSFGSTPNSVSGRDIYVAKLGASGGVNDAADAHPAHGMTVTQQRGTLTALQAPGGSRVLDAAIYSVTGERLAEAEEGMTFEAGAPIRFNVSGLPAGPVFVRLRTAGEVVACPVLLVQ